MKQKVLVCYLITKFDNEHALKDFIYNYKINNSGLNHDLLICFKLLNMNQINLFKNILNEINYVEFFDNSILNDYDLGSYQRVAKAFSSRHIFFLNSYSYPVCDLWLKKIVDNYENNSVVATSASYGSLLSSLKLKKFYKIIGYYLKLFDYKKKFNPFPNPHIRTTGFFIKASDYLSYMSDKTIKSKEDAWCVESGKKSLTNYFKNHGFKIFVVNSNGDKFAEDKWKLSETFNYLNQEKSIISDKHIRKYLELKGNEKKKITFNTWGVY